MTPKEAAVWKKIKATKLNDIAARAADHNHWDAGTTKSAIDWYQRYLFLCYKYKGPVLGITREADELWHEHILYTVRYRDDCRRIFKRFLDHIPTTRRVTKAKRLLIKQTGQRYAQLFFGPPPPPPPIDGPCSN